MLIHKRYRLQKLIGKGGFCQTFLAVDESQNPPVKCIVQQLSSQCQTPESFTEKVQKLQIISQYSQIPDLIDHFSESSYFYLVQEFIPGTNLANLIEQQGTFTEVQIWQLLKCLLPVIKFFHDYQIIHQDIKPENIILKSGDLCAESLILVDLGSAKIISEHENLTNNPIFGSPEYTAPEQAQGKAVFASDLYSLGVTCIYLLTQIPPFDLFDIANNTWAWREYLHTEISETLTNILDKLIQNDLAQRFQTADEVIKFMGMKIQNPKPKIQNLQWECLHTFTGNISSLNSINTLAISPDGQTLASGDDNKTIKLWDLKTQQLLADIVGHNQPVTSVAFSPDGQILASASDDKTIKLWQISSLKEICTLTGHNHFIKSLAFSPDGQLLASGSWDKTIKIWDVKTGQEISTLTGHQLKIHAIAFSPQGNILASGSSDRTIRLWSLQNFTNPELKNHPGHKLLGTLAGHTWAVLAVAFSPDGQILATGSDDNTIKLWEVNTGQLISTLVGHSWSVVALAFTPDGETLISASWDQTIKLWRVSTKAEIATLCGHGDSVNTIAVNPVDQLIASGSRDKTIKLWGSVIGDW
ncbi:MAG TPA: serine/threonine-protein kinase [Nostocaceae cyanobacterium]|nr:serine/threonine-protein kinase [Nostocaceae cyanobacterium]